MNTRQHLQVGI